MIGEDCRTPMDTPDGSRTPMRIYLRGTLRGIDFMDGDFFGTNDFGILFCTQETFAAILERHLDQILAYRVECESRNTSAALADLTQFDATIEPGAIVREQVDIGTHAVIRAGAVLNPGVTVGERTIVDVNAVLSAQATIGRACHLGAGAVIGTGASVEDNVLVGPNAVLMEEVRLGKGAVVAAGAVVTQDVQAYTVVAGAPARRVKDMDAHTEPKTELFAAFDALGTT